MILADTSVWIDHFRKSDPILMSLLEASQVLTHPFVIGEIALGSLSHRNRILANLSDLASIETADDAEVMSFIEEHSLAGSGIGYIDAHLLASVKISARTQLWTRDRKLQATAERLRLAATPEK
jgi:predicted nucleic acid-binding protein